MDITLESLHLMHYQGAQDVFIQFGIKNFIYGPNEAGKTRLFSAFFWLLFDKDSLNRKDFAIKSLDVNSEPEHYLNHSVEGVLRVDGMPITLKKVYSEKWTKKRNSPEKEFSGHTTDYFIDGVPVKQSEYKARVAQIVEEDVFKLLTNPAYFNEVLSWQDQRKILLEVAGDISDAEVITSNTKLEKLPSILGKRKLEDHRKVILTQRKEINDELERIPVRIDEAERAKPKMEGDAVHLQTQIIELRNAVQQKETELNRLLTGGEVAEQKKRAREIEGELLDIKNRLNESTSQAIVEQNKAVMQATMKVQQIERDIRVAEVGLNNYPDWIDNAEKTLNELRDKWVEVDEQQFVYAHDDNCPACGQALPSDQIQAAHDKAAAEFNRKKSKDLENIQTRAATAKNKIAELKSQLDTDQKQHDELTEQLSRQREIEQQERAKLEALQAQMKDVTIDPAYIAKHVELEQVHQLISEIQHSTYSVSERMKLDILDLRNELQLIERQHAAFAQIQMLDDRIAELSEQQKKLAVEFEELESQLYLTDQFIITKVNLLESKINAKFKHTRFKLFDRQINEGIKETCEALYNGVPYNKGLNHGMQILVGLDIIDTLQEHYGIHAPCWVDNAEAVTQEIHANSQLIALYASPEDNELVIESEYRKSEFRTMKEAV